MKLVKGRLAAILAAVLIVLLAILFALMRAGQSFGGRRTPVPISAEAFESGVAERYAVERDIVSRRAAVIRSMESIAVAKNHNEELLAEDPEWRELDRRLDDLNAEYEAARLEMIDFRETHVVVGDVAKTNGDISK
jgi:hypothetical protein